MTNDNPEHFPPILIYCPAGFVTTKRTEPPCCCISCDVAIVNVCGVAGFVCEIVYATEFPQALGAAPFLVQLTPVIHRPIEHGAAWQVAVSVLPSALSLNSTPGSAVETTFETPFSETTNEQSVHP